MRSIVIHLPQGTVRTTPARTGQTLAQAIFLTGLWAQTPLCSGMGKCGLCKVRFRSEAPSPRREEIKRLGPEAVEQGWRLACLHPAMPVELDLPDPARAARPCRQGDILPNAPLGLAVDLGTTSVHWAAVQKEKITASGSELNAQMGLGGEIMARLAFARQDQGLSQLRQLILEQLKAVAASLGRRPDSLCVAGNPAMLALLLNLDVSGLAAAPYASPLRGGSMHSLDPALPPAYIPPVYAPFVGADLSAGLAALLLAPKAAMEFPFLLADLGTNGEFILALSPEAMFCASVPMGPALEGVGLQCGRTAGPGAITAFTLGPQGPVPQYFQDSARSPSAAPPGITGTGHLSLAALLLRSGILDHNGLFQTTAQSGPVHPLHARLQRLVTQIRDEPAFQAAPGLLVPGTDFEEILKVKAAFNLAFSRLLHTAGIPSGELRGVHLAGAMGEYVSVADLVTLGFIPKALKERIHRQGNTSLRGAALLVRDPRVRSALERLPAPQLVDLAADPQLGQQFMQRMVFHHVR